MRQKLLALSLSFGSICFAAESPVETIFQCENMRGYSYYFSSAVVTEDESGLVKDGFTGSVFTMTRASNDLNLTNKTQGNIVSAKDKGATIMLIGDAGGAVLSYLVNYPVRNILEIYTYSESTKKLTLLIQNLSGIFIKSSIYVGECA